VNQPAKAPAVMMPSMPRLSTPARSQINSPIVAKISGEAMRIAATQNEAVKRISKASIRWTLVNALHRCALRCPPLSCRTSPPQGGRLAAVTDFANLQHSKMSGNDAAI
jgi:hypothetical protein